MGIQDLGERAANRPAPDRSLYSRFAPDATGMNQSVPLSVAADS